MRIADTKARLYYLEEASKHQWSVRQNEKYIDTKHYERLLSTKKNDIQPADDNEKYDYKRPLCF